jgi:3'-5' exoribonuclease
MPQTRINELQEGERATGFALLTKKELRQDRNGKDFIDLELSDASGSIAGKVWSDSAALTGDYEAHDFVAYKGMVSDYRGNLQLRVQDCRRATEADREHGFDESDLIPSTHEDIDDLWERLGAVLAEVERPQLVTLAAATLERHGAALREHPAAKTMHHAYRGGLLEHTVSMIELASRMCSHYRDLDRDLVLIGILFHDLGKLQELGAMPANEYTHEGRLVGHVVIGRDLLREQALAIDGFSSDLLLQLEHIVLSHQGPKEYGSPVEASTPEALMVHFIDNLDSKLAQFRAIESKGPEPQFVRGLGRWVYPTSGLERSQDAPEPTPEPASPVAQEASAASETPDEADADVQPELDLSGS